MQKISTDELLGQLDALHTEVSQVAAEMSGLHATKKSIDKKASVIGRALVEQKQTTEQVLQNQSELDTVLGKQMEDNKTEQEKIQNMIQTVIRDVRRFRNTEEREDTILKALNRLSLEQARYMTENQSLHKKASSDLSTVYDILDRLKQTLNQMDLGNQVEFMSISMERIQELLQQYADARIQLETNLSERMDKTEKQVRMLTEKLEEQSKKITAVVQIATTYEEKTTKMCEKFDDFLSNLPTETTNEQTSLEDLFADRTTEVSTEEPIAEDVSTEDVSTEEVSTEEMSTEEMSTEEMSTEEMSTEEMSTEEVSTEDVSTEEVSTEEVPETSSNDDTSDFYDDEDVYDDEDQFDSVAIEDDPDIQVIGLHKTEDEREQEERKESQKKKKGFFARMFGR